MPRGQADPIAQMIALQKAQRDERSEQFREFSTNRGYNLDVAKFGHQQAHDNASYALDKMRTTADQTAKYMSMAKDMYELRQQTARAADVGHFYNMLSEINKDAPDAADKIGKLKAAFPQAMQDEGVRATLANDWSDVLSHRGVSREDKEAADKRAFLMNYATQAAKDDEFGTNNPELKAVHDMYAKDLKDYEASKRVKKGVAPEEATPAAPQPLSAASFFAPQPTASPTAAPVAAGTPTEQPAAVPVESPVSAALPAAAVPPASTPAPEQIGAWAGSDAATSINDRNKMINDLLNDEPNPGATPAPTPTPPVQPPPKEEAV